MVEEKAEDCGKDIHHPGEGSSYQNPKREGGREDSAERAAWQDVGPAPTLESGKGNPTLTLGSRKSGTWTHKWIYKTDMNIWVTWNPAPSAGPEQPVTCKEESHDYAPLPPEKCFSPHPAPRPDSRRLDPNAIKVWGMCPCWHKRLYMGLCEGSNRKDKLINLLNLSLRQLECNKVLQNKYLSPVVSNITFFSLRVPIHRSRDIHKLACSA